MIVRATPHRADNLNPFAMPGILTATLYALTWTPGLLFTSPAADNLTA